MRRPVLKCRVSHVFCPDPTCRARQRGLAASSTSPAKFRGRGLSHCDVCGVEYFYHSADGVAEIIGLWPDEVRNIDVDEPLSTTMEKLGLMAVV